MINFDHLSSAIVNQRGATTDKDRILLNLLIDMTDKIYQLEMKIFEMADPAPFDERVLEVLDVRSGSARAALQLEDTDVQRWMLSAIEENSSEAFGHIEAEIEEKLEGFLESNSFNEAVSDAVMTVSGLNSTVEEILHRMLHDAIIDAIGDPEDIVRKGLRSIL